MQNILNSASKLVLLVVAWTIALSYLYVTLTGNVEGTVVAKTFDMFLALVAGAYFGRQTKKQD